MPGGSDQGPQEALERPEREADPLAGIHVEPVNAVSGMSLATAATARM